MGIGNTCGIIHNQTTEEAIYLLHEKNPSPIEQAIVAKFGQEIVKEMSTSEGTFLVNLGLKGKHKEEIKKIMNEVGEAVLLQPGRSSSINLNKVDF